MPGFSPAKLFAPPVFPDEEKTFAAQRVWAALVGNFFIFTILMLLGMVVLPEAHTRYLLYMGSTFTFTATLLYVARCGWPHVASVLAILIFAGILTVGAWTAGGVRAPAIMGFLVIVGMAGVLEGVPGIIGATVLCIVITLSLYSAEGAGRLPPSSITHTSASIALIAVFAMLDLACVQLVTAWAGHKFEQKAQANAAEREQIERARHESEAKFVTVFEASPDAIVITDLATGEVIEANPSYAKLFGYERQEMIGRTTVDLGVFGPLAGRVKLLDSVKETGMVRDAEMMAYHRTGTEVPCLCSGQTVMLGERMCLVSVVHDLTRRKQAELREQLVRDEFTRKLFASQEMERRRIAGELHDSLGQNLILIKNRAQMGLATAVTARSASEQFKELSQMATEAIAEVRQISHDLRPHQLDQLGLTRALESMFDDVGQNSLLVVRRKLDPVDDLFAPDDASHLYRVVQESLNNILKHSKAKTAKIGLERDLHHVRLWIEDDGDGFATPGSSSGLASRGPGAQQHQRARAHPQGQPRDQLPGGQRHEDRHPDAPLLRDLGARRRADPRSLWPKGSAPPSLGPVMAGGIKVLIVDDHPLFRQGVRNLLETQPNLELVGEAGDGPTALAMIRKIKPDVAVLDVSLPGMTGLEVAGQLQSRDSKTKIVILTMHNDQDTFDRAMDLGVYGFVLKDNAIQDIVSCIKAVAAGEHYLSPTISYYLVKRRERAENLAAKKPGLDDLTKGEMRVLKLIAQKKTSREIAAELFVSTRTIEAHRANISSKLALQGSHSLLRFALENRSAL